jgi:hypothetical protein
LDFKLSGDTLSCRANPLQWQIRSNPSDDDTAGTYFLVEWHKPDYFQLLGVANTLYPGCTLPDPGVDGFRTLDFSPNP